MDNRMYYMADEVFRNQYYQMPKFLFEDEFIDLSLAAKTIYTLIRDRHELSMANNWRDEKGRIYLIMTRDEMCSMIKVSLKTVIKAVNELKKYNLLYEERKGRGMANWIYLLQIKTCKNYRSRHGDFTGQDMEILQPNKTDNNKTDFNSFKKESEPAEPEKSKRKTYDEIIAEYTGNAALRDALIEFVKSRKAAKRILTNKALELLLMRLSELAATDEAKINIVHTAIRNGWADFYPIKAEPDPAPSSFDTDDFFDKAVKKVYNSFKKDEEKNE